MHTRRRRFCGSSGCGSFGGTNSGWSNFCQFWRSEIVEATPPLFQRFRGVESRLVCAALRPNTCVNLVKQRSAAVQLGEGQPPIWGGALSLSILRRRGALGKVCLVRNAARKCALCTALTKSFTVKNNVDRQRYAFVRSSLTQNVAICQNWGKCLRTNL
eukprot:322255-Rhodomonas_salina.1